MRLFVSGSAPLSAATHRSFRGAHGPRDPRALRDDRDGHDHVEPVARGAQAGTVGPPLPGVSVRVVAQADASEGSDGSHGRGGAAGSDGHDGSDGRDGDVGDVEVRGPNVFAGYWGKPDLTASEMTSDGWFRTGDLGRFDDDGYLELVGRSKDLVISGGLNVYPKEVEAVLDRLDGVVESAVIGVPDPDLGEAVVAVVVPVAGADVSESTLQAAARAELAGFKCPKRVFIVAELPPQHDGQGGEGRPAGALQRGVTLRSGAVVVA